jgi:hypothetical protein
MPNIAYFEGIKINIYNGDHLPPHVHVEYGNEEALLVIVDGSIYAGWLPPKQLKKASEWLYNNQVAADSTFKYLNPHLYARRKKNTPNSKGKKS